jgi:hypothetical protein
LRLTDLKKLKWYNWLLIIFLISLVGIQYGVFNNFVHLPSPIFGGDFYRDRGFVQSIVNGNAPWEDAYFDGHLQYYPYLSFALIAGFVKLSGVEINTAMLDFSIVIYLLGVFVFYLLCMQVFKDKYYAAMGSLIYASLNMFQEAKGNILAIFVAVPLFLYFWLKYEDTNERKFALYSGLSLGVAGLVHGGRFLTGLGVFGISLFLLIGYDLYKKKSLKVIVFYLRKYYLIILSCFGLASIFYLPILLKYSETYNPVVRYGVDLSTLGLGWALGSLRSIFFNFNSVVNFILGIIAFIGLIYFILNYKNVNYKFVLVWLLSDFILIQHHQITKPLFNYWFLPHFLVLIPLLWYIFLVGGFKVLYSNLKKYKISKNIFLIFVVVLLVIPSAMYRYETYTSDRWVQHGMELGAVGELTYDLGNFLKEDLKDNETVLANDETSFAIVAISGKRVVTSRRSHTSYFVDVDERIADAAVMMYSDDVDIVKELLEEYNVRYFYVDYYLFRSYMLTRPQFSDYLEENGVGFEERYVKLDPAQPDDVAYKQNMLIIYPQEFGAISTLVEDFKVYNVGNETYSVLYKVK